MTVPKEFAGRTAAIIAFGAAVIFAMALVAAVLFLLYGGESEDTAQNLRALARLNAEIDARPQVQVAYADLKARLAQMPALIQAGSGAPADAQVETAIKKIVQDNGGEVRSSQAMPSANTNGFEIVSVDCDLTVPASRLRDLLYAVETNRPYLFIDAIDITAPSGQDGKSDPSYEVRWTLHAYRWIEAG
jgi:hypothetical protein